MHGTMNIKKNSLLAKEEWRVFCFLVFSPGFSHRYGVRFLQRRRLTTTAAAAAYLEDWPASPTPSMPAWPVATATV